MRQRKHPRSKDHDYSQDGYYHVTICTIENASILSKVIVGRGLAPAEIRLTPIGQIIEEQLLELSERYHNVKIDKYVIMPTHLHAIVVIRGDAAGASPRPTLGDIICAFKSLSTRVCNQQGNKQGRKLWQSSFYDEIIRNEEAYLQIWQYIDENPAKWSEEKYYYKKQGNIVH
jgi:putative transposase